MDALEAIFNRRSIRQYTAEPVDEIKIENILKAAMHAPSAVNKQPWHFIVFRDQNTIQQIADVHPNASMLLRAGLGILVCWDEYQQHDKGYGPLDCSAATQNMLLAAYAQGLGAVWIGIYPRQQRMEAVHKAFQLPDHIKGFSIVAVGYPAENKSAPDRFSRSKIHREKW
jgi:nitroreductase